MRDDFETGCFYEPRDPPPGRGATTLGNVWLQNLSRVQPDQDVESVLGVLVLTAGNFGPTRSAADALYQFGVGRRRRRGRAAPP